MSFIIAVAALAVAMAVHAELLARLRRADGPAPWWLGYARDGVNLSAALMLWGAYELIGFSPPEALCAGMLTTLFTYLVDWTLARAHGLRRARILVGASLAAWVLLVALAARPLSAAFAWLIAAVEPRPPKT
jgi:hypothetical protein